MGKQARLKKFKRGLKEINRIFAEGIKTGKITKTDDGNLHFNDLDTAGILFDNFLRNPGIFAQFVKKNPQAYDSLGKALDKAYELSLELPDE